MCESMDGNEMVGSILFLSGMEPVQSVQQRPRTGCRGNEASDVRCQRGRSFEGDKMIQPPVEWEDEKRTKLV